MVAMEITDSNRRQYVCGETIGCQGNNHHGNEEVDVAMGDDVNSAIGNSLLLQKQEIQLQSSHVCAEQDAQSQTCHQGPGYHGDSVINIGGSEQCTKVTTQGQGQISRSQCCHLVERRSEPPRGQNIPEVTVQSNNLRKRYNHNKSFPAKPVATSSVVVHSRLQQQPSAATALACQSSTVTNSTGYCEPGTGSCSNITTTRGSARSPAASHSLTNQNTVQDSKSSPSYVSENTSSRKHVPSTLNTTSQPASSSRTSLTMTSTRTSRSMTSHMTSPPTSLMTSLRYALLALLLSALSPPPALLGGTSSPLGGLGVTLVTAQDPEWITEPSPTRIPEGGTQTLYCRIRNRGNRGIAWIQYQRDGNVRNLFIDGSRWSAPQRYTVDMKVDGFDLIISRAQREDDSEIQCQLQGYADLIKKVKVTVLVKPELPVITLNQSVVPHREGEYLELTCSTSSGNPPPGIRWLRNNDVISADSVLTLPDDVFGVTSSRLVRRLERADHRGNYSCTAENEANIGLPVMNSILLQVQYAPVLSFGEFNPLRVVEGEAVTLTCNIDAYPDVTNGNVRWEKNGVFQGAGPTLMFSSVRSGDSGDHVCHAENIVGVTTGIVNLDVQYPPKVTVRVTNTQNEADGTVKVTEGSRVNMTCAVDANPPLQGVRAWSRDVTTVYQGAHYVTQSVAREQTGNYSCHARNVLTPSGREEEVKTGSRNLQLVVQYRPGRANITGPAYAVKGDTATLRCAVSDPGVPAVRLLWTRVGSSAVLHEGDELTFDPARLQDNDEYICRPTNQVGDGTPTTWKFVVNELPEFLPNGRLDSQKTVTITQNPLVISCHVRGRPLPEVTWFKDGAPIGQHDGLYYVRTIQQPMETFSYNVTSSLLFQGSSREPSQTSLRISDAGSYSCRATSDVTSNIQSSQMNLVVQYKPVLNVTHRKVAIDINQTAVLTCVAHGVPTPGFRWYKGNQQLYSRDRIKITTSTLGGAFPYVTTLNISDVTAFDLDEYTCTGSNAIGDASTTIDLTVKTAPDPPTALHVIHRTWESVYLEWSPGFDGGYAQWFIVSYSSHVQYESRLEVYPSNAMRFNITGLFPATNYTFRVFGENELGGGAYSEELTTPTEVFTIEPPTDVYFHVEERTLTFRSPSTNYCVRVELHDGTRWGVYQECAPATGGSIKILPSVAVDDLKVALCLQRRKEICSSLKSSHIVESPPEDLPKETIIIVGCVCGSIVLILLAVLIYLCCRRHRAKKNDYAQSQAQAAAPPTTHAAHATHAAARKPHNNGLDNPAMDVVNFDDPSQTGVFSNNTSDPTYASYGGRQQNGHIPNGYSHPRTHSPHHQIHSNDLPPRYTDLERKHGVPDDLYSVPNKLKRRDAPAPVHQTHLDAPDGLEPDNSDSGVSTPDPAVKPKKVIYEVIV